LRQTIGNGWTLTHLTDRTVELRKESADYRRLTGADGFVLVRGEPGIPRHILIDQATEKACALDLELARRIAAELIPTSQSLNQYAADVRRYVPVMNTGEEPVFIGRKRA
jgi:hypothetical protein